MVDVRGVRDFRGLVVANLGRERGHQHQRVVDVVVDLLAIDFDAVDAMTPRSCGRRRRAT